RVEEAQARLALVLAVRGAERVHPGGQVGEEGRAPLRLVDLVRQVQDLLLGHRLQAGGGGGLQDRATRAIGVETVRRLIGTRPPAERAGLGADQGTERENGGGGGRPPTRGGRAWGAL